MGSQPSLTTPALSRVEVLLQALPYIQRYTDQTIVIKYGGHAMLDVALKQAVMRDLVLMQCVGIRVVLVHGGGPEIDQVLQRVGKPSQFVNGLRVTDPETMTVVQMVLAGKVNKDLVHFLNQQGGKAMGLCGLDGHMLIAQKQQNQQALGCVGDITTVQTKTIHHILDDGCIPVIAGIAAGKDGEVLNINADTAAAHIAAELGAVKLILMTNTRGVLRDPNDEVSLIPEIEIGEIDSMKAQGMLAGGMLPKIDCCLDAITRGVPRVHIIDGRIEHALLIEMFSDDGVGTMIYANNTRQGDVAHGTP